MFLYVRYSRILLGRGSASIWCVEIEWRRIDRHRWHKLGTALGALQNLTWPSLVLPKETHLHVYSGASFHKDTLDWCVQGWS